MVPDEQSTALAQRIEKSGLPVVLRLPASEGLVAHDELPAAAERHLFDVIGHRVDVLTPWTEEQVAYDARVDARDKATARIGVEATFAARETIEQAGAALLTFGLHPSVVDVAGSHVDELPRIDLLRGLGQQRSRWWVIVPACLAAFLLMASAVLFYDYWQRSYLLADRHEQEQRLAERASEAEAALAERRQALADARFLDARRLERPSSLAGLGDRVRRPAGRCLAVAPRAGRQQGHHHRGGARGAKSAGSDRRRCALFECGTRQFQHARAVSGARAVRHAGRPVHADRVAGTRCDGRPCGGRTDVRSGRTERWTGIVGRAGGRRYGTMNALLERPGLARGLALAVLAGLIAVVIGLIAVPLWLIERQHVELDASEARLQQAYADLARQAEAAKVEVVPELHGTIQAQSPALAGGIMQEMAADAVVSSGGELLSAELLPTKAQDRFVAIPIRVTFTADSEMLRQFLYRIETSSPVLAIDRLDISAEQSRDETETGWRGDIQVAAELVGWMRQAAPKP